jgi:hypothetical protein
MASIGVFQTMLRVQKLQCLFPMLNETTCPIVQFPKNKREEHEKEAENGHPLRKLSSKLFGGGVVSDMVPTV